MKRFENLVGKKFNRLLVIEPTEKRNSNRNMIWKCQCDCGNITYVATSSLKSNHTKSCGCYKKEKSIMSGIRLSEINRTHGFGYENPLYRKWAKIKDRCYQKSNISYKNYGDRGIIMCDEWKNDFMSFYNWAMANGYKENLTIDRIDVNGNYEPNNCRWATKKEQANNRRNNVIIEYNEERHTIQEWCEKLNVKYSILYNRLRRGWSVEKAFTIPFGKGGK